MAKPQSIPDFLSDFEASYNAQKQGTPSFLSDFEAQYQAKNAQQEKQPKALESKTAPAVDTQPQQGADPLAPFKELGTSPSAKLFRSALAPAERTFTDFTKGAAASAVEGVAGMPRTFETAARQYVRGQYEEQLAQPPGFAGAVTQALQSQNAPQPPGIGYVMKHAKDVFDTFGMDTMAKSVKNFEDVFKSKEQIERDKTAKIEADIAIARTPRIDGLQQIADFGKEQGKSIRETISAEGKLAKENSQVSGNILKAIQNRNINELSLGKDPSVLGYFLNTSDVMGSLVPIVATAIITKSPAATTTVGYAQGASEGIDNAREYINKLSDEQLAASSPYFKEMVRRGVDSGLARKVILDRAEENAAQLQGAVSAFGSHITGKLVTGGFDKLIDNYAKNRLAKIALGTTGAAAEEGTEEFLEGIATDIGINKEVVKEIGEESFANFVLGALGGAPVGMLAGGGAEETKLTDEELATFAADQARANALEKARQLFKPSGKATPIAQRIDEAGLEIPGEPPAETAPPPVIPPQMVMPGQEPVAEAAEAPVSVPPLSATPVADEEKAALALNSIPFDTVSYDTTAPGNLRRSSGQAEVIDYSGRKIVVRNINGVQVPFYLSTGHGGKTDVPDGKWYPFFGIGEDGWINKTGGKEMAGYYGSDALRQAAEELDSTIGDIRDDQSIPKVGTSGAHIDYINQGLAPTANNQKDTLDKVKSNIADVLARVDQTTQQAPASTSPALPPGFEQFEQTNADGTITTGVRRIETPKAEPVKKETKRKAAPKSNTLLAELTRLGGVSLASKQDVTGEKGAMLPGGYSRIFTNKSKTSLVGHIELGNLDEYLPYDMRLSTQTMQDQAYDSTPAYEYLAERIANGEKILPYAVEEEIARNEYYLQQQANAQDDINLAAQLLNEEDINELFRIASTEEREAATEAAEFVAPSEEISPVSGKREEAGLKLEGQTAAEIKAADEAKEAARKAEAEKEAKAKAQETAKDFVLAGSDRDVDQAAARGAQDLFAQPKKLNAQEFIDDIYSKTPTSPFNSSHHAFVYDNGEKGAFFELKPSKIVKGAVEVDWFSSFPQREGVGTKAMKELQEMAAKHDLSLTLMPWDKGTVSKRALTEFYKKSGFKQASKGSPSLVWNPKEEEPKNQAETNKERQAAKREKAKSAKPQTEREKIDDAVKQIESMDQETRENTAYYDMPGGSIAYGVYEAKKMLPKPSEKLKKVTGDNSEALWQEYDYIANVDGELYGVTKQEDPDEPDDESKFVYHYNNLYDPRNHKATYTDDVKELLDIIRKESGKPANKQDLGPQYETIKSKPGANVRRLADMLGGQLYGSMADISKVSVKEMFQNSFDAIKTMIESGKMTEGNVDIKMDPVDRTIVMTDDGSGMSADTLANVFLTIAGTKKETEYGSGGFGIAKMAFIYGNKDMEVVTMRDGKISRMKSTGAQLMDALNNPDQAPDIKITTPEETPNLAAKFPDGHGTYVKITIPDTYVDPQTGEEKEIEFKADQYYHQVLMKSPLFANINVKFNGDNVYIGSKFRADDYTTFADAKFDWGTARIYVSIGQEDKYGSNMHVLSNGLWQFSEGLKKNPMDIYGKNVPHRFYIDIVSKVKPDEAGYPFQLNRQGFTKDAAKDLGLIQKYLSVYYQQKDFENSTASFGNVQYLTKNVFGVEATQSKDLTPEMPKMEQESAIKEGAKVEVKDGRLLVNGKAVPDITPEQLKNATIDVDALKIEQSDIDPNAPMLHDNLEVPAEERTKQDIQEEMDAVEDAIWKIRERLEAEELSSEERKHLYDNWDTLRARSDDLFDEKYTPKDANMLPITVAGREKFGQRFDDLMFEIGDTFRVLRNATAEALDYKELKTEAVGISFDKEYRGVSIRIPFSGMYINPAFPEFIETPEDVAYGFMGTMVHELAHHKVRSHDADFPAEMQRIQIKLKQLKGFNYNRLEQNLVDVISKNMDIIKYLNKVGGRDESRPIGKRFKDGEFQATTRSDAENLVESGGEGWRGSELPIELRPRYQAIGEKRESESVPPKAQTNEDRRRLGEEILAKNNFKNVKLGSEKSLFDTVKETFQGLKTLVKLIEKPDKAFFSSMKAIRDGGLYLVNKNIFFGAALESRDIAKYNGKISKELEDGQIMAAASVALVNAINAGHIAVSVIKEGILVFDNKTQQYRSQKSEYSMLNVEREKQKMIKKYGKQNALNFTNAYFIAKRSQSIHDEYYHRGGDLKRARDAYDADPTKANFEALQESETAMADITRAFNKIPYTEDEMIEYANLEKIYPELRTMMDNWTFVNHNMLDQQAAAGVISKKEAARLKSIKDYVPWYRVSEDVIDMNRRVPSSTLGRAVSGLINIGQPKRFDDSIPETEINNVVENMLHNVMRMTRNTIRNHASNRVIQDYGTRTDSGKIRVYPKEGIQPDGAVRVNALIGGRRVIVEIKDPLVAESVLGMEAIEIPMLAVLSHVSNFRRRMISSNPMFQLRQWWMDAQTVTAISNVKNPIMFMGEIMLNIVPSLNPRDPIVRLFRQHGFGGHQTSARTPELELKMQTGMVNKALIPHMLKLIDHINDASDIAPRRATYNRILKETGDPAQALYSAMNIINFSKHGSGQLAQMLVKTVFFMNAYGQQANVLAQGFVGGGIKGTSRAKNAARFYTATAMFALSTLIYCMLKAGDDDYDELDDQTKIGNYILPNGIKIPMHTTYSFIVKSLVEISFNKINKEGTASEMDRHRLNKALQTAVRNSLLPPSAATSAVSPMIEVALNKNFFTHSEIVPRNLQNLAPFRQYKEDTSEFAKTMSALTGGAINPINMQYLSNAYFGIISSLISYASNVVMEGSKNRPTTAANKVPFMSDFILPKVPRAKEELFYDFAAEVKKAHGTFMDLAKKGHTAAADQWMKENQKFIEANSYVDKKSKALQKLNAEIRRVADQDYDANNPETWPDNKRAKMEEYAALKNVVLDDIIAFRKKHGM